ncbi:hypothetical protein EC968_008343 [Mortierella alpina]|nr:hypothetical protein EC968_008343 [Mortierella alpina]
MATKTEQNYGSTLTFSLVCSRFEDNDEGSSTENCTFTRTFEKRSPSLSQHGHWRCVFTESKRRTVELQLSMSWVQHTDTLPTVPQQEHSKEHPSAPCQVLAHELISRIQSIKIRSDSTLSELLVGRLDGRRVLAGDSIQGQVCLRKTPEEATYRGSSTFDTLGTTQMEAAYHKSERASEIGWRRTRVRSPGSVFFEDLYRVAERYEVAGLQKLSLKAMQCTLNMSIAISLLSKTKHDAELQGIQGDDAQKERFFNKVQMDLAVSIVKEYIQFFGTQLSPPVVKQGQGQEQELSLQERKDMIAYISDFVLCHITRLWE